MRVNSSPRSSSARAIRSGVSDEPEADVLGQRRLDLVQDRLERARERDAAQDLERLVGAVEGRLGVLDDAAERLERRPLRLEHRVTAGSTGSPPRSRLQPIRSPRTSPSHSANESARRPTAGRADRARAAPTAAAPTSSTVRAIGPSTGSGFHGSPGPASGITPGEGRRPTSPQNAAGLRTLAPRSDPSANGSIPLRHRGRRAAARPARRPRQVPRVARRAEDRVEGLRAGAELGRVRLADHDRARGAQPLDQQRVGVRHVRRRTAATRRSSASPPCPRGP